MHMHAILYGLNIIFIQAKQLLCTRTGSIFPSACRVLESKLTDLL